MVSFEVKGSTADGVAFIESLNLIELAVSLGGMGFPRLEKLGCLDVRLCILVATHRLCHWLASPVSPLPSLFFSPFFFLLDHPHIPSPGTESLIEHPSSMTHAASLVPADERRAAGIADGLCRLSVGIETVDDIVADLDQALGRMP